MEKPSETHEFAWRKRYGYSPPITFDHMGRYACAVMCIVGADGIVSEQEWKHFVQIGKMLGAPESMIEQVKQFDYRNAKLEDYLFTTAEVEIARTMLYDAIETASADGYHDDEKAAVRRAAKIMKIDNSVVSMIESIVELEETVRQMKHKINAGL